MTRQPTLECVEPKPPRRMLKPRKAHLYAEVDRLTADNARKDVEIARLVAENETLRARRSWLARYLWSKR